MQPVVAEMLLKKGADPSCISSKMSPLRRHCITVNTQYLHLLVPGLATSGKREAHVSLGDDEG